MRVATESARPFASRRGVEVPGAPDRDREVGSGGGCRVVTAHPGLTVSR